MPDPPDRKALKHVKTDAKNPIFVSVGHRISLETSLAIANLCCVCRREPEPTRIADMRSREIVRQAKALRSAFDLLKAMSAEVSDVSEAEVQHLKKALQDARSVVTDKDLLKPVNRVLTLLESGSQANQTKFHTARTEALAKIAPALGPPLPEKTGIVTPLCFVMGLGIAAILLRRFAR